MAVFQIHWKDHNGRLHKQLRCAFTEEEAFNDFVLEKHDVSEFQMKQLQYIKGKARPTDIFYEHSLEEYVGFCPVCNNRVHQWMGRCSRCKQELAWGDCHEGVWD